MMPARKYTQAQLDSAAELRELGMSFPQIREETGVPKSTAYQHCLAVGADAPPDKRRMPIKPKYPASVIRNGRVVRRFTPDEDATILKMSTAQAPIADIARKLNRRHNSILGRLATLGRHDARNEGE